MNVTRVNLSLNTVCVCHVVCDACDAFERRPTVGI